MGYLVKRATASGFEHRTIGQPVGSQLASCPSIFRAGPLGFDYRTGSSTEREHHVLTGRHGFDSRPEKSKPSLARTFVPIFRRVAGLGYLDKDAVAGSSPAFGSNCRSSSVVEHVNSQFVFYPSDIFKRGCLENSDLPTQFQPERFRVQIGMDVVDSGIVAHDQMFFSVW